MLDRLRTLFRRLAWDARISWRLSGGDWHAFRGVPDDVLQRWAHKPAVTEDEVEAVLMARDELTQRQCTWRDAPES
jgi:hypothetical protein